MNTATLVSVVIGVILGGGGIGALIPLLRFKTDRDNVVVAGAETAVQSLTLALKRADDRVTHLEDENTTLRKTIAQLRSDVDAAQIAVRQLTNSLEETKLRLNDILREN